MEHEKQKKSNNWWHNYLMYFYLIGGAIICLVFQFLVVPVLKDDFQYKGALESLILAVMISCVSTLLIKIIQRKEKSALKLREESVDKAEKNIQEMQSKLQSTIENFNGKNCSFCANSIIGVKPNREECKLDVFFQDAKEEVCILATNLSSFKKYAQQLCDLSKRGVSVKIATIDPKYAKDFNIARVTGKTSPNERQKDMEKAIKMFVVTKETCDATGMIIKTYRNIWPTLILIIKDGKYCYVANLIHGRHARDTAHLLVKNDNNVNSPYAMFDAHFRAIYDSVDCQQVNMI